VKISWASEVHAYNPSYLGGRDQEDRGLKPAWQIVQETLSQKYPTLKKEAGGMAQVVAHLLSKREAQSSNPGTTPPPKKGGKLKYNSQTLYFRI
jgi:hypothetical protein